MAYPRRTKKKREKEMSHPFEMEDDEDWDPADPRLDDPTSEFYLQPEMCVGVWGTQISD